ncbi:sugar phosphate isomerase/epimerase family protein [Pseudomonas coleopterorum]|uniref:Sugar phosphate isomerase/epimerase n=1 Tax=Pseudomonas coleopterorum TaxID=1605838 RepID=A0ABR9C1D0_9PSED|nr:sugar phosphate isomerase/epimerase [Pseudomonas coleopterorum]MBD8753753.1 sugar phosphate isomerase/epimerase [Pseudomonas coleopterorum]MBD8770945.1 sugar phosphate isomerase/epimerase [Pseudomonas coleopterorum]
MMNVATEHGLRGPGIFLAQFMSDQAPFDSLANIASWAASQGYKAIQLPTLGTRYIDLERAAHSQTYCDELNAICANAGMKISELSTHLQGQLVAVHPAFDAVFDEFAPVHVRGRPQARTQWASDQLKLAARASQRLGLKAHATFSGALLWPYVYPWPQRPKGLVEQGFGELARRWLPILDCFEDAGVDLCYEIHPGEDLHDGASFERFLQAVDHHPRAAILYDPSHLLLQQMDYLGFIDRYHARIRMFHVKDAEFRPDARAGVYGGYQDWIDRPGRFRSLGDGQVDFKSIFSKLTQYGFNGWAVLEWECCLKDSAQGAGEGAAFIERHMITRTQRAFDDFAGVSADVHSNRRLLGLPED